MSESFHQRNDQKFATNTQQTCHQSRQNTDSCKSGSSNRYSDKLACITLDKSYGSGLLHEPMHACNKHGHNQNATARTR